MYLNLKKKSKLKYRNYVALLGTGALLTLAGCSGGSSNNNNNNNQNNALPSQSLVALTSDNRLVSFNARTPKNISSVNITNLTSGDTIVAIDYRFPTTLGGTTGLYAIGANGASFQLYSISDSGVATAIGSRFTRSPLVGSVSIDFNPVVDRIRFISSGADNDNLRIDPNTGAAPTEDTDLAYAVGDANEGDEPNAAGAAYTNVDADAGTGTTLYVLDAANNTLVTQGSVGSSPISPNTGNLFTVANLDIEITENTGFDIASNNTTGFVSVGKRIYGIDLATGNSIGGASVSTPGTGTVVDIAVVPQ